ncbi:UPF0104 family protein [Phormidium tenue FACHB-886]|nr:UPF0104 family protein [Phormidium tenue FACHB-886]
MSFKQLLQVLPSLLGVILLGISVWAINQELQQYPPGEIWRSLLAIPVHNTLWALVLTVLNNFVVTGYDVLAVRLIHHPLAYRKTALAAITSTAIGNIVGFALFSNGAIRYRLYSSWKFSALEVTQIIGFCNLSFWLGLFAMAGISFLAEPITIPSLLHLPFQTVRPIGGIFLSIIAIYLFWNSLSHQALRIGNWAVPHLSLKLCLAQIVIASLDWLLSAAVLYVLLPTSFSYATFFGVYLLAQLAGLVSNVPGGLGVFETVILLLLRSPTPSTAVFSALLAYRVIYYLLPLGGAIGLLGGYEWRRSRF